MAVNSEDFVFIPVLQLSINSSKVLNFLPSLSLNNPIRIPKRVIKKKSSSEGLEKFLTHSKYFQER